MSDAIMTQPDGSDVFERFARGEHVPLPGDPEPTPCPDWCDEVDPPARAARRRPRRGQREGAEHVRQAR